MSLKRRSFSDCLGSVGLHGRWIPHETRDQVVDYMEHWTARAEQPAKRLLGWLELAASKFQQWKER